MSENTIQQIKNAEAEAQKRIALAKDNSKNLANQAQQTGKKMLNDAGDQVTENIAEILNKAKKDIGNLKIKNERNLATQTQQITNIDNRMIDKAADMVVKKIIK